ncbi:RNA-splicing ligase RtcB-like protein [Frankliniella fusca]|uniref:RNA-splicing ligase RtcB-like protein n=1 Tax=Frankliniella fusca TaxID=407009 RepID=A0AAE1H2Q3_9NEOP|nr:RNA-splicing ligase RtcB-like protein [Frankliniella fusca]
MNTKKMKANLKVGEVLTSQKIIHFKFKMQFRDITGTSKQHCTPLSAISEAPSTLNDGAASQYKNRKNVKNVPNIAHHEKDFNTPCQWHFFATSHGKSTCDSAAGAAKRSAALERKRRVDCEPIANPVQLYEYLKGSSKAMDFVYVSKLKVVSHTEKIQKRMDESAPVPGIRGIHTIIPISETAVKVKEHSLSTTERVIYITPKASSQVNVAPSKPKRKQAAKEKTSESEVQPPPKTTRTSGDSSKKAKQ